MADEISRKRKRYNAFRSFANPLPPKRSLSRLVKNTVTEVSSCSNFRPPFSSPSQCEDCTDGSMQRLVSNSFEAENGRSGFAPHETVFNSGSPVDDLIQLKDYEEHPWHAWENIAEPNTGEMIADVDTADASNLDYGTVKDCNHDPPVYPSCPLRLSESILLIMTLAIRHKFTGEALADVIKLVDLHCIQGAQSSSVKTLRELKSYFVNSKQKINLIYYCNHCFAMLTTERNVCPMCCKELNPPSDDKYFIVLPIEDQLSKLFAQDGFYKDLSYRFTRQRGVTEDAISDVYDGWQYKKLFRNSGPLSEKNNLSLKVNTDGVPIFKSSGFSLWPIYFEINELPPKKRRQLNNMILGGLWFGEHKPVMTTFLQPLRKALSTLETEGIIVQLFDKGRVRSHIYLISGVFDLPAKSLVLEETQFNGYCGCSFCVETGKSVKTSACGRGQVHVYPFNDQSTTGHAMLRTHEATVGHGMESLGDPQGKPVFGVKGVCQFAHLSNFDVVDGVAVDYMHGVLLGVTKQLLKLWLDTEFSCEDWYCGNLIGLVDNRLLSIKPPNNITRVPRSLEHHRKYWKASELRSWLFHYSLPCLTGILPDKYLNHYLLLVKGVWLLNQECIPKEERVHSCFCLLKFVLYFDGLYGERHMSMNVHNLLHLRRSVEQLSPLWANSSFEFEGANGELKSLFRGTQNIDMQIKLFG